MYIKNMKKLLATIMSLLFVTAMLSGSITPTTANADTSVSLSPWSFFQTGTSTNDYAPEEICAFSKVTNSVGETFEGQDDFPYGVWSSTENKYIGGDTAIGTETTKVFTNPTDNFKATIISNGWNANYDDSTNNPYTLSASSSMELEKNSVCNLSFNASIDDGASNKGNRTTIKYVQILVMDETGWDICINKTIVVTTEENSYTCTFTVPRTDTYYVRFLFGAFIFTDDVVESQEMNWSGTINMSNISVCLDSISPIPEESSTKPNEDITTTLNAEATTQSTEPTSTTKQPATQNIKVGKASILSVKIIKGKKAKIKIKKLKNISGYQIQYALTKKFVKKKNKFTTKLSYTVKNLRKNKKYFFRVRAYKTVSGQKYYGQWSSVWKIKISR